MSTDVRQNPVAGVGEAKPLTGRTVLLALLAFFGVVIAINVTMMTLAISTMPGTEAASPYREGNAYNAEINAAHEQDGRGLRIAGHIGRDVTGDATVALEARDQFGTPVDGLAITVRFMRPTDQRADRTVALMEYQSGGYGGDVLDVAAGAWDVEIDAEQGGVRTFRSKNRVVLK